MEKQKTQWKRWHKVVLKIIGVIFFIIVVFGIMLSIKGDADSEQPNNITTEQPKVTAANWDTLNYEAKQQWIKETIWCCQ